jgi:hypothetical protein
MVFDLNLQSVKTANARNLMSDSQDFQPHYVCDWFSRQIFKTDERSLTRFEQVTRRYAELMVSTLYLSVQSESIGDITFVKRLNHTLAKLREEMESLLLRMADARHKGMFHFAVRVRESTEPIFY